MAGDARPSGLPALRRGCLCHKVPRAVGASAFRPDPPRSDVPVLVMHGSADRILPISATSDRLPDLLGEVEYMVVDGGPHAINWTHAEEVNSALLGFLRG